MPSFARPLFLVIPLVSMACGASDPDPTASPDPTVSPPAATAPEGPKHTCVAAHPVAPRITLPRDEARHGDFFEWWYWTGHLADAGGRAFGFQLTFFESTPRPGIPFGSGTMAHFAITDVADKTFHHDYRFAAGVPYAQKVDRFDLVNETWWARGTSGAYEMHADMEGYTLDLSLQDEKRAIFHFEGGFQAYPPPYAGYTYYDSRPRLAASGTVHVGNDAHVVSGEVWMDQQWGQPPQTPQPFPLPPIVETRYGWSWFQVQLDTGVELMLVTMDVKGKTFLVGGTYVDEACAYERLDASAFVIEALGTWTSPHTGTTYPQDWRLRVPGKGIELVAKAVARDQEIYKHGQGNPLLAVVTPSYWEGKVDVSGTVQGKPVIGKGYAEAVGAAK